MRRRLVWGIAVLLPALAVWGWLQLHKPDFRSRVYRIGWMISPPFQLRGADGRPAGLAVELVREAARRRGIDLQWIFWNDSSERALQRGVVDLWPLITITPERRKRFHISEPYIETEHCLLVRADSPYRRVQDLMTATIGLANTPIDLWHLEQSMPEAHPRTHPLIADVIEDVCRQHADAAFMDAFTGVSALLADRACDGHALRWIPAPSIRSQVGVGATFAAAPAADAIREEIGNMAAEGKLAGILDQWGFMSSQHLESMEALLSYRRREVRLLASTLLFAVLFVLGFWQTWRLTRERNRTRRAQEALHEAEQRIRLMANNLKEMVLAYDLDRNLIYANPAVETVTGYSLAEHAAQGFIDWIHPDDRPRMLAHWEELFRGATFQDEEYRLIARDGGVRWMAATWGPMLDDNGRQIGVQGSERDVTDRKHAEEALRESQERYMQAQKLEGIGRLAGGVAHDFNNLLTVINGYSDIVFRKLPPDDPLRPRVDEIRRAGARATDLTQQLLAFSRKQVIQPRPLDLNEVVAESERMFRRLLGEDIQLFTRLQPSLGLVMADAGQMHQVLLNLVVNARDAMPDGGNLFIETAAAQVDSRYVAEHPEAVAGPAVLLTVTDSGAGIDADTRAHIFEPFFTTKGAGSGTGLGLATVYGIVKQSHGWIAVYSEPGKGTSFQIHLPRLAAGAAPPEIAETESRELRGSETVLVVEDQEEVRSYAVGVLESYGYKVLEAADGAQALALADRHQGSIDVLLTDVVLPGMNGRQLAGRLAAERPGLKVLYTSGYTQDVIAHRGVLDRDVTYLAKPYTAEALAAKLRSVM
ncbi:MAG TPA: ATP-binding protein [Candidatus Sulfopaludibacter sp.]|nr:ATP-binding protein [Candidatus Sulfopaludibacter sp.]